jgi:DNA-binding CsgD family transcriptional regulator
MVDAHRPLGGAPRRLPGVGRPPLNDRQLSVIVLSLFASWMLAFLFEGRILYALARDSNQPVGALIFSGMAAHFAGLFLGGFLIKTRRAARRLFLCSFAFFIAATAVFFFPPSGWWLPAIISSSLLAGGCVAAWGHYFRSSTPSGERIRTAADVLICSNILMILLNVAAIHLAPRIGLGLSMLLLSGAFVGALRLPVGEAAAPAAGPQQEGAASIVRPLGFLCLFIIIITINSGLMYRVLKPAYAHLEWLTIWYWAIPYIVAIFIVRGLPRRTNRTYILYVALAMIGFSFIAFMSSGRSVASYLVVNTLMLGACGVYDLFWWSILGEMLELHRNPARVFGIGLSANVLGVLLGGLLGSAIASAATPGLNPALVALAVVCVTFALLPLLHKHLSDLLHDHAFLSVLSATPPAEQVRIAERWLEMEGLSERESQVATLLLRGKTYRMIAAELQIRENTVKYYVRNVYTKLNIQSRTELAYRVLKGKQGPSPE